MAPFDDARGGRERGRPHLDDWSERTTLRLRRCEEPIPDTTLLYAERPGDRTVEPLELEIAQPLPGVCSSHGLPAPTQMPLRALFYDTNRHPRSPRFGFTTWYSKAPAPMSAIVVGSWPSCAKCLRTGRRGRRAAKVLLAVMVANFAAFLLICITGWLGLWVEELRPLIVPLALGVFPGSLPIGAALAMWLHLKGAKATVYFDPIDDERFVTVRAHPNFRAAVEAER